MRPLLVDHHPQYRAELRGWLEWLSVPPAGEAASPEQAEDLLERLDCNLIFLDVCVSGASALTLARKVSERPRAIPVIITADHPYSAAAAFDVGAIDYLVKPYNSDRLLKSLTRARFAAGVTPAADPGGSRAVKPWLARLPLEDAGKTLLLRPEEIGYACVIDEQVYVGFGYRRLPCGLTMRELEERLGPMGFVRTHRRFLVNLCRVREVIPYFKGSVGLVLDDPARTEVPVSRALSPHIRYLLGE